MKQQTLTFRFHNPNTAEDTADYILRLLLGANREKLEQALLDVQPEPSEPLKGAQEA